MYRLISLFRYGSLIWKLPALVSFLAGTTLSAWQYVEGAHWAIATLAGLGAAALVFAPFAALMAWAYLPRGKGYYSPNILRVYELPVWRVSWDLSNFVALSGRFGEAATADAFQAKFRVNRGSAVLPKACYIFSERTGQRLDLDIENGNPYVPAGLAGSYPKGKWWYCLARLGEPGLSREQFLLRFDDFDFVFEHDQGRFKRRFSREEVSAYFGEMADFATPRSEPRPGTRHPIVADSTN